MQACYTTLQFYMYANVAVTSQMCIHDFVHVTVFLLTFTYKSYVLYCLYCIWLPFVGCL